MFERIGAFAELGSLFLISYPKRPVFVFVIVFGTAIVLELAQIFIPTRDPRVADVFEKLAGGVVGVLIAQMWRANILRRQT